MNRIFFGIIILVQFGCKSGKDNELKLAIEDKLTAKYLKMEIEVDESADTLNIILYDTFPRFSVPYADLRATYIMYLLKDYLPKYQAIHILQIVQKDTLRLRKLPGSAYGKWFLGNQLPNVERIFDDIFEFWFCVNYIMDNVPPEVYDDVCNSHLFNINFLEGYVHNGSFTNLLMDFTSNCQNPEIYESLVYKEMRMLGLITANDLSNTRTEMFNVFFNICNKPKLDVNEIWPFRPTKEYEEILLKEINES